jgi:hypothetical protein
VAHKAMSGEWHVQQIQIQLTCTHRYLVLAKQTNPNTKRGDVWVEAPDMLLNLQLETTRVKAPEQVE